MNAVLDVPDGKTQRGQCEHALLLFLYNTGARVSEAVQLTVGDLQIGVDNGRHALGNSAREGGQDTPMSLVASHRTGVGRAGIRTRAE